MRYLAISTLVLLLALTSSATAQDLVINEIMANPSAVSDSDGEWFEIYNNSDQDIDLDGYTILDDGVDSHVITGTVIVPAMGYAVLGRIADPLLNGGVSLDYAYGTSWFLSNTEDEIVLLDPSSVEVDRVAYTSGFVGAGVSKELSIFTTDNHVLANWCDATLSYGDGDLGTPGEFNTCETAVPTAQRSWGAWKSVYR